MTAHSLYAGITKTSEFLSKRCSGALLIAISRINLVISVLLSSIFRNNSKTKYMRKIIDTYTSKSAPLWRPKILPRDCNAPGKNVNTNNPHPIAKKTKKCKALNFCLLATSSPSRSMISQEIIKKISKICMVYSRKY